VCFQYSHSLYTPVGFFLFGILTALLTIIITFSAAFYIFSYYKHRNRYSRWQLIKMGVCFFVVVGLCACALYLEVLSVIIHFSATDPLWSGFPQDCTYQTPSKVYNCVRIHKINSKNETFYSPTTGTSR